MYTIFHIGTGTRRCDDDDECHGGTDAGLAECFVCYVLISSSLASDEYIRTDYYRQRNLNEFDAHILDEFCFYSYFEISI